MERIKYDPKEFQMEFMETRFGPSPVFHTPITPRANWRAMFDGKNPLWMPLTTDSQTFCPRVDPDNIARGFVFDGEGPYDRAKYGGPDMFGIEWVFVPVVGGSMENPDNPHPLEDANDWRDVIKFPDPYAWDWDASARLNNEFLKNNGKANMFWFLNGMGFERLISFMGFENAAMALLDEDQEDALHELLHALTDLHIKMVDLACDAYGDGVSGFCLHDDWGSQKSPFFSTAAGKEFFVPEWKRFTDHIHARGKIADLHSCGHIEAQIENIVAGGWDSWTPMPMNDTHALYEKYGDRFCFSVCADKWDPATATEEEQYEAGKKFAEKFFKPGKVAAYSFYSGLPMPDAFARGIYETSRKLS